ncbi:MAG TPA: hypothetical protein VFT72_11405 [Opitutaceae bacterium]|nr:hypothetical protein [Opitutaceae bacterium]
MSAEPVICFGQQPCGFFPRRFLYSKFVTARRLQAELGGRIVFFFHDSDHDPRETQTTLTHRRTGEVQTLNFAFENKLQRKFSPLFLKRVPSGWRDNTARQLPAYVDPRLAEIFKKNDARNVADFCLEMYQAMGLLEGVELVRSSAPEVRTAACDIGDFFVDVSFEGEVVRARHESGVLKLHEGGESYRVLPPADFGKAQISPTRDSRLRWMQSVIHCTHYIAGLGEQAYLRKEEAPEIVFVNRDPIDRSDEAFVPEIHA